MAMQKQTKAISTPAQRISRPQDVLKQRAIPNIPRPISVNAMKTVVLSDCICVGFRLFQ